MKEQMPLVSIRIAAYNHEKYIKKTLSSILEDSYPNKEIVIIDDGSTDATPTIIESWIQENKDHIPIKYKSRANQGLTKTINELIEMCSGDYICGVASDDFLIDNGIQCRVTYLLNNPNKMAVFGNCYIVDASDNILYHNAFEDYYHANIENYSHDNSLKKEIISRWSVPGPVLMVRRELYNMYKITYNTNLSVEDWDMYLKLVSKDLVGFTNCIVSAYRIHDTNTSLVFQNKIIYERIKTVFYNLKLFNSLDRIRLFLVIFQLLDIVNRRLIAKIIHTIRKVSK